MDTRERRDYFSNERWTAAVVGLGYVGLPLCVTAVDAGLAVIGYDISEARVSGLLSGRSPIVDVPDDVLGQALDKGLSFTTESSELSKADAVFLCVPSPLGRNREPDMSSIVDAARTFADHARTGQLVSLESTTYPGTLEEVLVPALEDRGLKVDVDVFVAFSPERVDPGNEIKTAAIPKVVGGLTPASTEVAAAAYSRLVEKVHVVSNSRVAEMTKLLENTYRAVNIGLVNELAMLARELDIDIWEVIDAAKTKPFGFQAFYPGPGVGGHCIPLDPQYLAWRARQLRFPTRFIDLAEQTNAIMPAYVVDRIGEVLNRTGQAINGSKILAVGLAYKPDVADYRESAAMEVVVELIRRNAHLEIHDPVVGDQVIQSLGFTSADRFSGFDLAVILTDHSGLQYEEIAEGAGSVFDTRNVYRRLGLFPDGLEVL
ncbi:MAG: nucleotide sugar dehydrogenase [Acidimicrobiia bacterium]|nr:nucleotide sugar dehydrogenase [Acidimicrobiia bacterium]